MTDREALLKATSLLAGIANTAGGHVSRSARAEIDELRAHTAPYHEADLARRGFVLEGNCWTVREEA